MIRSYFYALKDIHQDRLQFEKQITSHSLSGKIAKQEGRYQAYIIGQMAQKNMIIAAAQIRDVISRGINRVRCEAVGFIKKIAQYLQRRDLCIRQDRSEYMERQSMTVDCILLRLYVDTIVRVSQQSKQSTLKRAIQQIKEFSFSKKKLQKLSKITSRYYLRQSFRRVLFFGNDRPKNMFDQSFSVIGKHSPRVGLEQSCLSFILGKQNAQAYPGCQQQTERNFNQDQEIIKMRQQMVFLRKMLAQKTLQMKKKQEYWQKKGNGLPSISQIRNDSSIIDMQRYVLGGKRIRKNLGSISYISQNGEGVSRQLLGKYMKESFQLKQTMDIARQQCIDLLQKIPISLRPQINSLVKTLSTNQQVSLVDEY